jgi:YD repeat-containing protein
VYRTDTYDVNPSTGSAGSKTLYSLTWRDARGNVIETLAPGGVTTKDTFDGAGRPDGPVHDRRGRGHWLRCGQ